MTARLRWGGSVTVPCLTKTSRAWSLPIALDTL